ncbi:MAG: hypothetical protein SXG53_06685 [Pseudomonadota bacterium]|nr:hypothetical protein [Pseudomonadota bacterium]
MEAIGGYFDIEVQRRGAHLYPQAHRFQSGRAALLALLEAGRPKRVWLPWYICSSVIDTVAASGAQLLRYGLNEQFEVDPHLQLGADDWLVYVNYFGLQDDRIVALLRRLPAEQVIVDNAQSFYSAPTASLATVYSPRKFFGVPDGGYLVTKLPVAAYLQDEGSIERMAHLLIRAERGAEAGYAAYQSAEQTLERQPPRAMSPLTAALLAGIDYESIRKIRRNNFDSLHAALGDRNLLQPRLPAHAAPLCYPYLSHSTELRSQLIAQKIFVPTYWPEVAKDAAAPELERKLSRGILPLPCDQRYGSKHVQRIVATIRAGEV